MTLAAAPTDEDLALKASSGDKDAFGALYERHYRGVYDLVVRMVRDHELAVDIVQNSFLNAWTNLQKRKVTGNIKAWLYTIARNNTISELRRGKRTVSMGERMPEGKYPPAFARVDAERLSDPQSIVADGELVNLVWTSAAALSAREYSLLDLHVRRGLSTDDLSQTLGVPKANLYTQLSRLKDSLEESVTVNLLMRRARNDCPQLDTLAAAASAGLTRDVRQVISRHIRDCERCRESRKRYLAPAEIFAGLALVPAPMELDRLWLGATAGAGFLALILAALLAPVRWLLDIIKGGAPPLKAAVGTSLVATIAIPAAIVTLVNIDEGNPPTRPEAAAAGAQPLITSAPVHPTPEAPAATTAPTPEATPAPPSGPTPIVAAAVASPRATQAAALASQPTPPLTLAPVLPADIPTPGPLPTSVPTPAPTPATGSGPVVVRFDVTLRQAQGNTIVQLTIFGAEGFSVSGINLPTLRLGGAAASQPQTRDVDNDGHLDLVLEFELSGIAIPISGEWCLEGQTLAGVRFSGCARIL